jgi:hypothetical protein
MLNAINKARKTFPGIHGVEIDLKFCFSKIFEGGETAEQNSRQRKNIEIQIKLYAFSNGNVKRFQQTKSKQSQLEWKCSFEID